MLALRRSAGKMALLMGALMTGVCITYFVHAHNPFISGGLTIITLLPFLIAGMLGVAKTTTV